VCSGTSGTLIAKPAINAKEDADLDLVPEGDFLGMFDAEPLMHDEYQPGIGKS